MIIPKTISTGIPGPIGIRGFRGETGTRGPKGDNGLSSYQIWLSLGNVGTMEQFIALQTSGSTNTNAILDGGNF